MLSTPDSGADAGGSSPARFSVVVAAYNVAPYLASFIGSVEQQTFPLDRIQVIVVDDGSEDDSLAIAKEWQSRRPKLVTVLSQANAGAGAARNAGLELVTADWVTFADPDDLLAPDYFARVDEFIRGHDNMTMVATYRLILDDRSGETLDQHPLRRMFTGGDHVVDLKRFPERFHNSTSATFMRTALIRRLGLQFDARIRPSFEDAHFCAGYLLASNVPLVGFVSTAHYIHRRRLPSATPVHDEDHNSGRYVTVSRHGFLDLLRRGADLYGEPPEWLQNLVLYHLSWYLSSEAATSNPTAAQGSAGLEFVDTLREMARYFSPGMVESFGVRRFDRVWRDILIHGLLEESWVTPYVVLTRYDAAKNLTKIAYRFVGPPPEEMVLFRGEPIAEVQGKTRRHEYFGQTLMRERIAWVPSGGTMRVFLNGKPVELRWEWPDRVTTAVRPAQLEEWFEPKPQDVDVRNRELSLWDKAVLRLADSRPVKRVFGGAWVLMDRVNDADDNGERLFRYLREHRRGINAWFVLEAGTPDWQKLKNDGFKRLIPYGSLRWRLLMLNCAHLASSHLYPPVRSPQAITRLKQPQWKLTFLQHGVIKDDLSRWLNGKPIDLFITSTPQEHESIVHDDSPYDYTSKEVKMAGLPRFDRLRELGERVEVNDRDLLLVCPTWRNWLNNPLPSGEHERSLTADFFDSEYAKMWVEFLSDDRLRVLAEQHNLRVGFLPHPNIQPALQQLALPAHIEPITYANTDIQALIASAAVMITDYSSMAFNAAYIDRPVVYFQFDADRVLGGGHTGRVGYYEYERDGFGPVTETVDEAVSAVVAVVSAGRTPPPEYARRIIATFPERDGKCCERVVAEMQSLSRRSRPKKKLQPTPSP